MKDVFVLFHVRIHESGNENVKLIGVYGSEAQAVAAKARAALLPGFRVHPNGFSIQKYTLDQDHWTEGFGVADGPDKDTWG